MDIKNLPEIIWLLEQIENLSKLNKNQANVLQREIMWVENEESKVMDCPIDCSLIGRLISIISSLEQSNKITSFILVKFTN